MKKFDNEFLDALNRGQVCLHPAETLPGFTFDPLSSTAKKVLYEIKGREAQKTVISLVGSFEKAKMFWEPLPPAWEKTLTTLWPAPLSVSWKASRNAPSALVNEDGFLALRCPRLLPCSSWLQEVLDQFPTPLPSTSVNRSGELSCKSWKEAQVFCEDFKEVYVPELQEEPKFESQASTLIQIQASDFILLREGKIGASQIRKVLKS